MGLYLMSKKYNIVHISQTPLVAAPAKLAIAQRLNGHKATAIALNDYPGALKGMFFDEYLTRNEFCNPLIDSAIEQADIIHVHNDLPEDWVKKVLDMNQKANYIYHVHSPLREGPLYLRRSDYIDLPFVGKFIVGQYQPRIYPGFTLVPNVIIEPPSITLRKPGEKLKVIFSPTHLRPGRWNNKFVEELDVAIRSLVAMKRIEAIIPEKPVHPKMLMAARRTCHVTIDEIATGGFHQVSLEGLAAGNIVINRADYFAKMTFSSFCNGEFPPFMYSDKNSIAETLTRLADDWDLTNKLQLESFNYFSKFLTPIKMSKVFDNAYELL